MNQIKKDPFCIATVQWLLQLLSQSPQIKSIFTLKTKEIKERDQHRTRDHQFKILSMCSYRVKVKIKVWHLTAEKKKTFGNSILPFAKFFKHIEYLLRWSRQTLLAEFPKFTPKRKENEILINSFSLTTQLINYFCLPENVVFSLKSKQHTLW